MKYVKMTSWHIIRTFTRGNQILTLCGKRRMADEGREADAFDSEEKTCESCFRIAAKRGLL